LDAESADRLAADESSFSPDETDSSLSLTPRSVEVARSVSVGVTANTAPAL